MHYHIDTNSSFHWKVPGDTLGPHMLHPFVKRARSAAGVAHFDGGVSGQAARKMSHPQQRCERDSIPTLVGM